jgi:hypothetical protein
MVDHTQGRCLRASELLVLNKIVMVDPEGDVCSQTSPSRMVDHDYFIKDIQFTCSHTCLSGMADHDYLI